MCIVGIYYRYLHGNYVYDYPSAQVYVYTGSISTHFEMHFKRIPQNVFQITIITIIKSIQIVGLIKFKKNLVGLRFYIKSYCMKSCIYCTN